MMMTNKTIKSLIDKLNQKKNDYLFQVRPLSATVDFAKLWLKKPVPCDYIPQPHKLYFIKNEENFYVAAVLIMIDDLHWFVLEQFRGKGYLTKAMKETILFHLFQDRREQKITIDEELIGKKNFISSEKVALSLGFIKIGEITYRLTDENYLDMDFIEGLNKHLPESRMYDLKKQINFLAHSLLVIQNEFEMKLGVSDYSEELKELVDEMQKHPLRLETAWWEAKKINQ